MEFTKVFVLNGHSRNTDPAQATISQVGSGGGPNSSNITGLSAISSVDVVGAILTQPIQFGFRVRY